MYFHNLTWIFPTIFTLYSGVSIDLIPNVLYLFECLIFSNIRFSLRWPTAVSHKRTDWKFCMGLIWISYKWISYKSHINLKRTGIFFFCLGFLSRTFTILDHKSLIVNCFSRPHPFKSFKGYLPQILLGPLLNISSHIIVAVQGQTGTGQKYSNIFENNQIACGI